MFSGRFKFKDLQIYNISRYDTLARCMYVQEMMSQAHSPLLPNKADVELAALQVFAGVAHDLVEGIFQQMVTTDDQPEEHAQSS